MTSSGVELSEEILDHIVKDIVEQIQSSMLGMSIRKSVEAEVSKSNMKLSDIKKGVSQVSNIAKTLNNCSVLAYMKGLALWLNGFKLESTV